MNVRRSPRIRDRFDRAEVEGARSIGACRSVPLKVLITLCFGTPRRMVVDGIRIALPDLYCGVRQWLTTPIQHASGQIDRNTPAQYAIALDAEQIRIGLRRTFSCVARIKRAEGLRWADAQRTGRRLRTRQRNQQRACRAGEKVSTLQRLCIIRPWLHWISCVVLRRVDHADVPLSDGIIVRV